MNLEKRINAFVKLGLFLKQFKTENKNDSLNEINQLFYEEFQNLINRQKAYNGWFDEKNVRNAISSIAEMLSEEKLKQWLNTYSLKEGAAKNIGVIMAGNIPLVGFHDFLTVLITGNNIKIKLSSNDKTLLPKVAEILTYIEPEFKERIAFVDKLVDFDAVLATGSNNTSRYFKQYFGKYPHLIRNNKTSIAIISEDDTKEDIEKLGQDVFTYYGLGCRNVSKLFLPKNYPLDNIFEAFYSFGSVIENNKYANNYDYNKAVYLLGNNKIFDNNFLLMKEEQQLDSPVGVLYFEYYDDMNDLNEYLNKIASNIQCVVSSKNTHIETFLFGEAQNPGLGDYADGVDTVQFVNELI